MITYLWGKQCTLFSKPSMDWAAMIGLSGKTVILLEFFQIKHGAGSAVVVVVEQSWWCYGIACLKFKVVALMKIYI